MKLAIVIPVHNQMRTYQECITSLVGNFPRTVDQPVRFYVIDNGSSEPFCEWTLAVAASGVSPLPKVFKRGEVSHQDMRIHLTRTGLNLGVTKVWNMGMKAAFDDGADVVCISNSDVVYGPCVLERCAHAVHSGRLGLCWPLSIQGGPLPDNFTEQAQQKLNMGGDAPGAIVDTGGFAGWSFFLPRTTYEVVGLFDEQFTLWYQDTDYHDRLHEHGIPHAEIRNCLVHHYESKTIKGLDGGFDHQGWRQEDARRYHAKRALRGKGQG